VRQLEPASYSVPLMLGLVSALRQLGDCQSALMSQSHSVLEKSRWIWESLSSMPKVNCLSNHAPKHGLVSFTVEGLAAVEVKRRLMDRGFEVAANQASFTPLDMQARNLNSVVRVSAHSCTTQSELEEFVAAVANALAQ
jgi:cysteine desulfurase/selenocysteine lyase